VRTSHQKQYWLVTRRKFHVWLCLRSSALLSLAHWVTTLAVLLYFMLFWFVHLLLVCWLMRRRLSLLSESDILCFIMPSVFLFFFYLWCDCSATAGRIFPKSSTDVLAVLFINGGTPMKSVPLPKKLGVHNVHFLEQKFWPRHLRTAAAWKQGGILEKLNWYNYNI